MAIDDKTVDSRQNRNISGNTLKTGLGDEHRLVVDDNGYLKVILQGTSTISGTVTIQDGGNSITIDNADITAIKTAIEIMDDWDESDKCKTVLYGFNDPNYVKLKVNASGELSVYTP